MPLTPSGCLLASFLTVAVPSVLSRVLDVSWGQWRINRGAPAPGPLRLGALKIENEKVVLMF